MSKRLRGLHFLRMTSFFPFSTDVIIRPAHDFHLFSLLRLSVSYLLGEKRVENNVWRRVGETLDDRK